MSNVIPFERERCFACARGARSGPLAIRYFNSITGEEAHLHAKCWTAELHQLAEDYVSQPPDPRDSGGEE